MMTYNELYLNMSPGPGTVAVTRSRWCSSCSRPRFWLWVVVV